MASDVELLRKIILALQDQAVPEGQEVRVAGYPAAQLQAHRQELQNAKLIDVFDDSHLAEKAPHRVVGLTPTGQVFSERIRDEPAWNEAKVALVQRGEALTLPALMRELMPKSGPS